MGANASLDGNQTLAAAAVVWGLTSINLIYHPLRVKER
jgi:hypothetical protein